MNLPGRFSNLWRASAALLVPLLVTIGSVACGGGGDSDTVASAAVEVPRRGGTAVFGSISDVDSWNEYLSRQTFANDLQRRIFLRLAEPLGDSRGEPPTYEPQLAESWSFSDDGRTLTFRLRGASWSDGHPLGASDVRFTWQAQTSPEVAWVGASVKEHIEDVRIVDDRTVSFHFDKEYPDQLSDAVEGGIVPEHVFGAVPFSEWRTHDWSHEKIASGPFLLEEHRPAEEITLRRNPSYFREELPRLDRVVFRIVPDAGNLLNQLLAGHLDYMEGVPPRDARRVRETPGATLVPFDEPKYDYIGWNGSREPFDDPLVRRALTLATDRRAIVEDLLYGFGRVSRGPAPSFWWGADRETEPLPYDPEEAVRLLRERGFAPGEDGILARNGRPLDFTLTTNAGNRLREGVLVKVQEQLARIGVRVRPSTLEMKTFIHKNVAGEYDAYLSGWRFTGKLDLKSIFGSGAMPPNGMNVVFYRSSELDSLLDAVAAAPDWRAMKEPLRTAQRRIGTDLPYTFLYETQRLAASGSRLHGVEIDVPSDPLARLERYWVEP